MRRRLLLWSILSSTVFTSSVSLSAQGKVSLIVCTGPPSQPLLPPIANITRGLRSLNANFDKSDVSSDADGAPNRQSKPERQRRHACDFCIAIRHDHVAIKEHFRWDIHIVPNILCPPVAVGRACSSTCLTAHWHQIMKAMTQKDGLILPLLIPAIKLVHLHVK